MKNMALKLAVIQGTKRDGNKTQLVARHIARIAEETGDWEVMYVDPNELKLRGDGNDDSKVEPKFGEIAEAADAFFIVTPEYNHSFPGTLKNILDSELKRYIHKPVSVAGVSGGGFGGARVIVHLAPVLRELGLMMTFADVNVSNSYDAYNEETGEPNEGFEYIEESTKKSLVELKWMAETLKYGRDNIPSQYHEK